MDTRGSDDVVSASKGKSNVTKLNLMAPAASKQQFGLQRTGHLGARTLKEGEGRGRDKRWRRKWFGGRVQSSEINLP